MLPSQSARFSPAISIPLALLLCVAAVFASFEPADAATFPPAKLTLLKSDWNSESLDVWVFFSDKQDTGGRLSKPVAVSEKALARRAVRGSSVDADWFDREVSSAYREAVLSTGAELRQQSRWLNGISISATPAQVAEIAELPFVTELREVAVYRRELPEVVETPPLHKPTSPGVLNYGNSFGQLDIIQVIDLHNQGLSGEGVTILILDTGFKLDHEVFRGIDLLGTYDFINDDTDVQDDGEVTGQQSHGTSTLSTIAAFLDGTMIGAAYNASFLVAKTEDVAAEIQQEEDNWVAAIEWGEENGADIATSSLGYDDWYNYSDFDGNRAVTTKAADIAASLGVIVVNSIGNDGHDGPPSLNAPADGDSVIAVGAIDLTGRIAAFSSNGPTADGRIKPDVLAPGVSVLVATSSGGYGTSSGTSFSCPLAAGVCALLLEAHPDWTYGQLYGALTGSATRALDPDNVSGYGIIRAERAANYTPGDEVTIKGMVGFPNPFNPPQESIEFAFEIEPSGPIELRIYTVAGEKIFEYTRGAEDPLPLSWDGTNQDGEEVASGVYIAFISGSGISETYKIVKL